MYRKGLVKYYLFNLGRDNSSLSIISKTMGIYIILSLILGFVAPIFLDGRIKKKSDKKALIMLCRILAVVLIALTIYRDLL